MFPLPFRRVWWGVGLKNYRETKRTYEPLELETLPPISDADLDGSFSWLLESPLHPQSSCESKHDAQLEQRFEEVLQESAKLGLRLPDAFVRFMSDRQLRDRVWAKTGSYWHLDTIEPCPGTDGYITVCRSDGEECLLWYLYLEPAAEDHCVLVSEAYFGSDSDSHTSEVEIPDELYLCADSFESFVYREWIEHWAAIHILTAHPLTPREQGYLDHYRPPGDTSDRRPKCELHDCPLQTGEWIWIGAESDCLEWAGNFPPEVEGLPARACLWKVSGWKRDDSVEVVGPQAFCPMCRSEMLANLRKAGRTKMLDLLREKLNLEIP